VGTERGGGEYSERGQLEQRKRPPRVKTACVLAVSRVTPTGSVLDVHARNASVDMDTRGGLTSPPRVRAVFPDDP